MIPQGLPKKLYTMLSPIGARETGMPVGSSVWLFTSGKAYHVENTVRDNRYEIRIKSEVDFKQHQLHLTMVDE